MERRAALEYMREVNETAEQIRRKVLSEGGCLIVFPEGTRNESELLPLRSRLEIGSALVVAGPQINIPVTVWPVVLSFGKKRFFRRSVIIDSLPPFPILGDVDSVVAQIEEIYQRWWKPADVAESQYRAGKPDTLST
jgi:1-acyl-sn-glycerol-3-phosphate acyltransferase